MAEVDVIIGVGSPNGDDQIGWRLIDFLRKSFAQPGTRRVVKLLSVNDPVDILDHLNGVSRAVVVDACRSARTPGTFTRLDWRDPRIQEEVSQSSHRISLADTLELSRLLGRLPSQVILYVVDGAQWEPQSVISPQVAAVVPRLADCILRELQCERRVDCERDGSVGIETADA